MQCAILWMFNRYTTRDCLTSRLSGKTQPSKAWDCMRSVALPWPRSVQFIPSTLQLQSLHRLIDFGLQTAFFSVSQLRIDLEH
jgi:hypothetical protein